MGELIPPITERAGTFGRAGNLVGILTEPEPPSRALPPAVVFLNSGIIHRVGANRIYVRLARALGLAGIPSFRFDLSGVGDSGPPMDEPGVTLAETAQRDCSDALSWLETQGVVRFVLAGLCSGADHALSRLFADERVIGGILMDPYAYRTRGYYLRYYGSRLLRPSVWRTFVSTRFTLIRKSLHWPRQQRERSANTSDAARDSRPPRQKMNRNLQAAVDRGARLLYVFTAGLEQRYNYGTQFFDAHPEVDFRGRMQLEYFSDSDHTFSQEVDQAHLEELIVRWCQDLAGNLRAPGRPVESDPPEATARSA